MADFENSIVARLTEEYKNSTTSVLTAEKVEEALEHALSDYAEKNAKNYSTLTEEQVKAIVENALGTMKYEGVTEEQVRAIVKAAANDLSTAQVTAAQVKQIVNAANAKNLTSTEVSVIVAQVIADAELATDAAVEEKINAAVTAINNAIANVNPLTEAEVDAIITRLVPVTKTATTVDEFTELATTLNSGSTIVISGITDDLSLNLGDDAKTLYIKGIEYTGTLTINAPNADITVLGEINTIQANAVKASSLHVQAKVELLIANKGRVVVEPGFTVTTLVAVPAKDETVKVVIEETAKVKNLYAQYQDHKDTPLDTTKDFIKIENNGTVENASITASAELAASTTGTTTNVEIKNGVNATGTTVTEVKTPATVEETVAGEAVPAVTVVVQESGEQPKTAVADSSTSSTLSSVQDITGVARIGTVGFDTLQDAVDAATTGDTIYLLADIECSRVTINGKVLTIDGEYTYIENNQEKTGKYSITTTESGENARAINVFHEGSKVTFKNLIVNGPTNGAYTRGINIGYLNVEVNIINCEVYCNNYAINIIMGDPGDYSDNLVLNVKNSLISGWAAINHHGSTGTITVEDSTLIGTNNNSGTSNSFATIVICGSNLYYEDSTVQDNNVIIKSSTIIAKENTEQKQWWISFQYGANNNQASASIDDKTKILDDFGGEDKRTEFYNSGADNIIKVALTQEQIAELRNNCYVVEENDDYTCSIKNPPINIFYAWPKGEGLAGKQTFIATPFVSGWLEDGEYIILTSDAELSKNISCQLNSGAFYFIHTYQQVTSSVTGTGKILLNSGVTAMSDIETTIFATSDGTQITGVLDQETGLYFYTAE